MTVVETDQGQNEFGNAITSLQKYEDPPKEQLTKIDLTLIRQRC